MRLLLPPSEAKTSGGRGRSLASRPAHPVLGVAREAVLVALQQLLEGARGDAARALGLPPGTVDAALAANACVRTSATTPALRRYAGVVYEGLSYQSLPAQAQHVAARSVLVFSGLFGVIRGDEAVPNYRVPATAVLPGVGVVGTYWARTLRPVLLDLLGRGLIIDLRSSDYAAMWRPDRSNAARVLTVRVLTPGPRGPAVISHPSKLAKGRLAAALVRRVADGHRVDDVHDVAAAWLGAGGIRAEVIDPHHLQIHTAGTSAIARDPDA